ncbi:glycosyltransferase family 2 protein, partial [uncultured Amaricoccus sp.]|uniref:glycosyltransferase family 2 protein n=1 Tax=uncultured Amaricoccus sp. TaxID=339341 RepID=UPI0026211D96
MDRLVSPLPAEGQAPLEIRANPMLGSYAATVCTIVHDEMFILEAFLAHYRRLGADRFIILDDRSTDGTREFLAGQPDVMVIGSGIRYFAQVSYPPETLARIRETRAVRLWRDQMLDQFCTGQWAVVVDPDEFLAVPSLPALFAELAAAGAEAAWGVMVDMYPERVRDILGQDSARFRLDDAWFFDAKPHLDPRQPRGEPPQVPRTV